MIRILRLLLKQSLWAVLVTAVLGGIAGAGTAALLALINQTLSGDRIAGLPQQYAALCGVVAVTGVASQVVLRRLTTKSVLDLRMALSGRIIALPLRRLEEIGPVRLLTVLTEDIPTLGNATGVLPTAVANVATLAAGFVY